MVHYQRARQIGLTAFLSLMLSACNYEYNQIRGSLEKSELLPGNEMPLEKVTSFTEVQQSVFSVRCQTCHEANGVFTFEDYKTVLSMVPRIENRVFSIGDMPPRRPLTEEQKALLLEWIGQGAPL